ncbi:uncharacterized protein CIMG_07896 [Coccidioides immitis RS]|uniref:Pentatricopeptide repeat protein n=2 Tax=Coccidioides immitis TaxID=5501 RepID=A0A0J8S2D1_COCIT|nr:uncharacterized protein CIMG_07896 [Coccidioides immitis RS]EAS29150.3 hypothetical protein CIMG_07896 [Coccidioides immitis RS]KMP06269.1 pentatricopeptide repeat protein [Coccidioides immitis RMSCC 2394]KMU91317.1 pentatricopeptide repeat protein [Coccidioides immitis H538.4]
MACANISSKAMLLSRTTPASALFRRVVSASTIGSVRCKHVYMRKENPFASKEALRRELKWVGNDRVALMNRIEKMLTDDEFEKAVALVMAAEKEGADSIASWNALLSEELKKNGPDMAFKLFNDIKKRGVKPIAQTYTILFRELSKHQSRKAVKIAMSLYNSLKPDSSTPRSIVHTNAMLQVCSNHNDMDTLWEVAGELPSSGPDAPDSITYSIILNAIHKNTKLATQKLHPVNDADIIAKKKIPAIRDGRIIWMEVTDKWRKGLLAVDEGLIFQMANLLIFGGRRRDCFDLLALLEQSMNIKRPEAMLKLVRAAEERTGSSNAPGKKGQNSCHPTMEDQGEVQKSGEISSSDLFKPIYSGGVRTKAASGPSSPSSAYPLPTNRELTVILRACRHFAGGPAIGRQYWTVLTAPDGPFRIDPDRTSYHEYLRTLRATRSSAASLEIIQNKMIPKGVAFTNTFVISLSTCFRDKLNPNILDIAGALIDIMPTTWAGSHPKPISAYVDLVRETVSPARLYADTRKEGSFPGKSQNQLYKDRLLDAVRHLVPHIKKLQQFIISQQRNSTIGGRMYDDEEEEVREHGASSPAALADESHRTLKRIAGMMKDLLDPSIAPLLSDSELAQLKTQSLKLRRLLNPISHMPSLDQNQSNRAPSSENPNP